MLAQIFPHWLCAIVCVIFTLTDLAHYETSIYLTIMHTGKIRRFNKVAIVVIVKGSSYMK